MFWCNAALARWMSVSSLHFLWTNCWKHLTFVFYFFFQPCHADLTGQPLKIFEFSVERQIAVKKRKKETKEGRNEGTKKREKERNERNESHTEKTVLNSEWKWLSCFPELINVLIKPSSCLSVWRSLSPHAAWVHETPARLSLRRPPADRGANLPPGSATREPSEQWETCIISSCSCAVVSYPLAYPL